MGATRQDRSGVLAAHFKDGRVRRAAVFDHDFHLSPKGLTFVSNTCLTEWMEVGVQMRLPRRGVRLDQATEISCRGFVVQCTRLEHGRGFEVTLVFLDLAEQAQAELSVTPLNVTAPSIAISN